VKKKENVRQKGEKKMFDHPGEGVEGKSCEKVFEVGGECGAT